MIKATTSRETTPERLEDYADLSNALLRYPVECREQAERSLQPHLNGTYDLSVALPALRVGLELACDRVRREPDLAVEGTACLEVDVAYAMELLAKQRQMELELFGDEWIMLPPASAGVREQIVGMSIRSKSPLPAVGSFVARNPLYEVSDSAYMRCWQYLEVGRGSEFARWAAMPLAKGVNADGKGSGFYSHLQSRRVSETEWSQQAKEIWVVEGYLSHNAVHRQHPIGRALEAVPEWVRQNIMRTNENGYAAWNWSDELGNYDDDLPKKHQAILVFCLIEKTLNSHGLSLKSTSIEGKKLWGKVQLLNQDTNAHSVDIPPIMTSH